MVRVGAGILTAVLVAGGWTIDGVGVSVAGSAAADTALHRSAAEAAVAESPPPSPDRWTWPVAGASVTRPYVAPATRYASGHRGIDLGTSVGASVVAPAEGVVLFVGRVVDRGVLTLAVGDDRVVTLEPVATALTVGTVVGTGDLLGTVDVGGHAAHGNVHVGVRVGGEYVDPMRFFGGTPRAILLPCC